MPRRKEPVRPQTPEGGWRELSPDDPNAFPLAVVFDLDYTLWDLWIDTHISPPLKRNKEDMNLLTDRRGQEIAFYPEVTGMLAELKERRIHVAAASRTRAPELAREALSMLVVPGVDNTPVRALSYFNSLEIYPGTKLPHFRSIHRKTGIPFDQMLFFDDEHRNFEVEQLGVTMQLVTDGMNRRTFNEGLAKWRHNRGIKIVPSS